MSTPRLSVIVPTYNRAAVLAEALQSMAALVFDPTAFEIVVVDNGSPDDTPAVVERCAAAHPGVVVRYVLEPVPGLLAGRHRGAQEARGEILVYADDDIIAAPGWLSAIDEAMRETDAQLMTGKCLPRFETEPPDWIPHLWPPDAPTRVCGPYSCLDLGDERTWINPNMVWGLNFTIRRAALVRFGGFAPDCMPPGMELYMGDGETGLTNRLKEAGYKALYEPRAEVHHLVSGNRLTIDYLKRRAHTQGISDSYADIRRAYQQRHGPGGSPAGRVAGVLHEGAASWRGFVRRTRSHPDPQWEPIRRELERARREGYRYHRAAVRREPRLRDWVVRTDYWDYRPPEHTGGD